MDQADIRASGTWRLGYFVVAAATLGLWGASFIPPYQTWGNPNEDGFSYIPLFWATLTMLPVGVHLLIGGIVGHGKWAERARTAFYLGCILLFVVMGFLIFQRIANGPDG